MICSTIIPTIGRPTLTRAVTSVLEQSLEGDDFEVIVVNDSGKPLPDADWMTSPRVTVLHTNRHNRSVARNSGAAVARGRYLHFLDDDDWMLPGAFQRLREAAAQSGQAGWVYGGFRLTNNEGEALRDFCPPEAGNCLIQMVASEWIPLQASWIDSRAFFRVGGFASLESLGGGYEDIDLSRMIALHFDFARTNTPVAVIRYGDKGSTTDYNNLVKQNRLSREKVLDAPGAFSRMQAAAKADKSRSSYWQGKIIYYYLVSAFWNLKNKRIFTGLSRLMFAGLAFARSIFRVFSPAYWRGAFLPHHNAVRTALRDIEGSLYTTTVWKQ